MEPQQIGLNLTQVVALIGCITGCLGLAINIYRLYRERYCLKIDFQKSECIYFEPVTSKNFSTKYQGLVHMIICNKSVNPITIHDAYLVVNNHYSRFEKYAENSCIKLLQKNSILPEHLLNPQMHSVFPMNKQFETPLRLQAYDSFEGYGFIPILPHETDKPIKISIIFKTAKRPSHKTHVTLHAFSD